MNLDIISAEENLRREIKKMNLELVDANSVHEPFNHAVKTSWPEKQGAKLSCEVENIKNILTRVADKYNLRLEYRGPEPASQGKEVWVFFYYS